MPIKFKCPHCKKPLSVKDHLAGKKAACPVCKKALTIPAPVAAAADLEEMAAKSLFDEPVPEKVAVAAGAPAPTRTIDFNCPFCDAELHLPGDMGGKQAPCPECKHILKVPKLISDQPKDWREVKTAGPSAALLNQPKELEGAWGTATSKSKVSREALEEADAIIEEDDEPAGIGRWIKRGVLAAVLIGGGIYGYMMWSQSRVQARQLAAVTTALAAADKAKLPALWTAEMHRGIGEFYTRAKNAEQALKAFREAAGAVQAAKTAQEILEADALLMDIALNLVDLGGSGEAVENKERIDSKELLIELTRTLDRMQSPELRQVADNEVTAKRRKLGQQDAAAPPPQTEAKGEAIEQDAQKPKADPWTTAVLAGSLDEAQKQWKMARTARPPAGLVLQFIRLSARADVAAAKELLKTGPIDKHVKARANLECLLAHLEQSKTPAEFALAEEVGDKESSAYAIAWLAIARQKSRLGQRSEVLATQTSDEKLVPFLHIGAALGEQDVR